MTASARQPAAGAAATGVPDDKELAPTGAVQPVAISSAVANHKRIVRSRPQRVHSLTSARACSLAKINSFPHETRGSHSQGSRVGTKIMVTTSCLRLRSGGSPIRAGPPEDPLRE